MEQLDLLLKCGSLGVIVFLVIAFLRHIEKKDETIKEVAKSLDGVNLNLVALQKDNEVKDQILDGVARSMDKLADTLKGLDTHVRAQVG